LYSLLTSKIILLLLTVFLGSCGEKYNFNQLFVSAKQKESLESLLNRAEIAYDKGDFDEALTLANKAGEISPGNEKVAILQGYIHLSLSGMDPFLLAKALVKASSSSSTALASSSNASSFLSTIRSVLNVTNTDLQKLGEYSNEEDLVRFKDYDIILPDEADDVRTEAPLSVFTHINAAISKICPFVDESVKTPDLDSRHSCTATSTIRTQDVVSHFLWAFVHIAEAAVFYGVLQYQNEDAEKAHLQLRADALESDSDSLSVGVYVQHAVSLATAVNQVFAIENPDSQISAVLNNIFVATQAFAAIGNIPDKMKKSLEKATESITDTKDSFSGESEEVKQRNALKAQLNEKMSGQISSEITKMAEENPTEFAENKTEVCDAYTTISGGADIPSECE